ncbi:fructose-bisphosphate aldolase class I [Candidatus Parcubacteria bacterium]|nr:fructose-bisphosphate aldolase class I [Candidatus Parcubacteria bacterium]
MTDISETARTLTTPPKGVFAADESPKSADKRLASYGIKTGIEMRYKERDMFLSTPGIEAYLSGVILHEETLNQTCALETVPCPTLLLSSGILPGIKVDQGTEPMSESPKELITKGLLGLSKRLHDYKATHNTAFTKWRAVITIEGNVLPSATAIVENAKRLAMYARCAQEAGMVPIVEPEVLYTGTHSIFRSKEVITEVLQTVMRALDEHGVDKTATIVKSSMTMSGKDSRRVDTPEEVAAHTLEAFLHAVPQDIPGIIFLSGGQDDDQATDNLRAIAKLAKEKNVPWNLTFSYSRALQDDALKAWGGKDENVPAAREAFLARLTKVSAAAVGT